MGSRLSGWWLMHAPSISMLGNAFQRFLSRADQEALLARVREHLTRKAVFSLKLAIPGPSSTRGQMEGAMW